MFVPRARVNWFQESLLSYNCALSSIMDPSPPDYEVEPLLTGPPSPTQPKRTGRWDANPYWFVSLDVNRSWESVADTDMWMLQGCSDISGG
jgi:hypothetical protein